MAIKHLALEKIKTQRDLLKFTINQILEIHPFQDQWPQGAKVIGEIDLLIELFEMELGEQAS